jgi:hypothetical protein
MDELGIGFQMPALHEVVVGGTSSWAYPLERDLAIFNVKRWNEFMVGKWYGSAVNANSMMTLLGAVGCQPLSATRDTNVGTPSRPMFQVITLLRMPTPKPQKTHRRQPTDTTLTDSKPELDLRLAVYSSK